MYVLVLVLCDQQNFTYRSCACITNKCITPSSSISALISADWPDNSSHTLTGCHRVHTPSVTSEHGATAQALAHGNVRDVGAERRKSMRRQQSTCRKMVDKCVSINIETLLQSGWILCEFWWRCSNASALGIITKITWGSKYVGGLLALLPFGPTVLEPNLLFEGNTYVIKY